MCTSDDVTVCIRIIIRTVFRKSHTICLPVFLGTFFCISSTFFCKSGDIARLNRFCSFESLILLLLTFFTYPIIVICNCKIVIVYEISAVQSLP